MKQSSLKKQRTIFVAMSLMIAASPSYAVKLVDIDGTTLSMGGYLDVQYLNSENSDEITDGSPRVNFSVSRALSDGWTGYGLIEWGLQIADSSGSLSVVNGDGLTSSNDVGEDIFLRLGYVGAKHEQYGAITVGKQWSSIYNVVGVTDAFMIFGGNASGAYNFGTDGGFSGVGRADQSIQYNNQWHDLTVSLQYQATNEEIALKDFDLDINDEIVIEFDSSIGVAVLYQTPFNIKIGAGHNQGDYILSIPDGIDAKETDKLTSFSMSYGELYQEGIYLALVYSDMHYHEKNDINHVMKDASGTEMYLGYRFDNNIEIHTGFNALKDKSDRIDGLDHFEKQYAVVGATYFWSKNFVLYAEGKFDDSTSADGTDISEDIFGIGARINF